MNGERASDTHLVTIRCHGVVLTETAAGYLFRTFFPSSEIVSYSFYFQKNFNVLATFGPSPVSLAPMNKPNS